MASSRNRKPPEPDVTAAVSAVLAAAGVGPRSRLCVALSGGIDSVVLLHALATLRARFGYALTAAHVHHGLSSHADRWRAFCSDLCVSLAVDFHSFFVTVCADDPAGLEAAARRARHSALARVATDWLAFGHHQDDQVETVLFRLLRGTGVRGAGAMGAIEPGSPGRLRPLLALRRAELVAHARALGLAWVEDESNGDHRFTRNRIRHEVLPALEAVFPSAVPALARAAEHFREADALLAEIAERDAHSCGDDPLDLARVLALPDARIRNLLRWRIRVMGADAPPRARLDEALRQLRAGGGAPLQLPLGRLACCAYRGALWLEEIAGDVPVPVRWRGERALAWGMGRVEFEPAQGAGLAAARLAAGECELTSRWEGLVMRQGVGRPRRSFRKLCQQAGVPAWLRDGLPVLRIDGAPAWIAEVGVAPEFACAPGEPGLLPRWLRHVERAAGVSRTRA